MNKTKKLKYKWSLIIALFVVGGISSIGITKQPKKLYNTLFSSPPAALTEQDYINYLKKHEKEITDAMLDDKITSIQ
ncbi:MAG: hypothetical protein Q4A90_10160 [Streptococcus sp.]|nr:hypothetical protein [Streptococcus sp.]